MTTVNKKGLPPLWVGWSIWGLASLLYLLGFYHRVSTNVLADSLKMDFALTAAGLGNLSACYFYSYFAMQLPTGIFVDRWGPRRLLSVGAFVSAIGTLIFAMAPSPVIAGFGRLLVGGSVAVAYVCMMRLAADWFPRKYFTIATGCGFMVGVIGGSAAGAPLVRLLGEHGWRPVMFSLAILGVLLSILIWWRIRDKPSDMGYENYGKKTTTARPLFTFSQSIRTVFSYRNSLLLMFVPGALSGSVNTFCGLWGNQFLTSQYGMTVSNAALVCTAVLIVWSFSAPLWGMMSEKMARRKPLFMSACCIVALSWSCILFFPDLPISVVIALLLFAGFGAGSLPISYAFAKESVPHYLAGTAGGLNNGSSIFGTVLMQPVIGIILDRHATHGANGELIYQFSGFQYGFGLFIIWSLIGVFFISRLQETYCRQQD